jgi:hypothetical protein
MSLPAEFLEKQLQALERFHQLLVAINSHNTDAFQDIMAATNGEIVKYLRILPSAVKEKTKDLMPMGFRTQDYTIFSGFENAKRLVTDGIDTVR